jgi:hypothetical protein
VSTYTARGTSNQQDSMYRDKENRQRKHVNDAKDASYIDDNFSMSQNLNLLLEEMISDCYSLEKPSKENLRDFLLGINKLREGL